MTGFTGRGAGVDGLAEGDDGPSGMELVGSDGVTVGVAVVGLAGDSVVLGAVSAHPTRAAASATATAHRPTIVGP
jgi:hypothetical protein